MGNIASHPDIMQYESKIWACADTLIACSIKQSDSPVYMMPFFALVMLEGRMLNKIAEIEANEGITYAELIRRRSCKSLNSSTVKDSSISISETGASSVSKDMCCTAGSSPVKTSLFHRTEVQGSISGA
ncbi:MAG: hypothetical protein K2H47_00040 [Muribaculaceae bacterium]|nr:hypothetical protein [Muribaculaceae bacterium]